jgi:hypothetical protein
MIKYEAKYNLGKKPAICKSYVENDVELVCTELNVKNTSELEHLSNELISEHLDNLLKYIKDSVSELSVTPIEKYPEGPWPLVNWEKTAGAAEELVEWWHYVETKEEHIHEHEEEASE